MDKNTAKEDFLTITSNYSEEVQHLAIQIRDLIFEIYPETVEVPWVIQKTIGYGIGPKKMSEHFCYMVFAQKHVSLGFNYGVNLNDPTAILDGTGKKFRSTKMKSSDDVYNPNLLELIKEAIKERKEALKK
jgi:hypothetical protein